MAAPLPRMDPLLLPTVAAVAAVLLPWPHNLRCRVAAVAAVAAVPVPVVAAVPIPAVPVPAVAAVPAVPAVVAAACGSIE